LKKIDLEEDKSMSNEFNGGLSQGIQRVFDIKEL